MCPLHCLLPLPVRLAAPSGWTWILLCEAAVGETLVFAMANGNTKEGLKSENNHHINLKVARKEGSVVRFKVRRQTLLNKQGKPI